MLYKGGDPEGKWGNVIKEDEVVTISGDDMSKQTLTFTPSNSGPKQFKVPGPGTYTIKIADITKDNLHNEETILANTNNGNDAPYIIDTLTANIVVDENGIVSSSVSDYSTYVLDYVDTDGFIYNEVEKSISLRDQLASPLAKLNPHAEGVVGVSSTDSTVTLTVAMSSPWCQGDMEVREQ